MANRPWGTPWGQFKQGIRFSQPLNDPLSIIGRFFSLKSSAKRALAKNDLGLALECYTKALEILLIHPQQHLPAQIANEHHLILCNRSLVHYKQGLYKQAEDDALAAIEICPRHLKSYWRACQAIIARSRDKQQDAMSYLVKGLSLTFQGEGNRRDQIDFLTELCKIAIEAPRTDKMVSMLCSLQLPDTRDKVWLSVLKNLMDQNKWESMAMILIHYDPRGVRHSLNTLDVTQWHCSDINIGKLLSALSDDEMQRWGEQLAVCLLQKGAIVDTIGEHYMTNALHFVVKLSLRIGSVRLLRHVLENYKDDPEMMNSKDEHGNTAIHIVAKSEVNEDFCEAVLTLLLKNNCDASIQNKNDKKPIDFISKQSKLFSLLKQNSVSVQELRETLEAFKTEGNKAKKSKEYTKALQMYDEALDVAQQSPELYKEAAILYSNKSNVLHQMNEFEGALANAIAAVNSDPEYSKGYYRNGKALLCLGSAKDAFITFIDGCLKSKDDADTITLLIEATTIIDNLSSNDIKTCYEMLFKVETSIWPSVLTQLSKKAEWKSIAYLILGSNLDACRCCELFTADCIDQFCSGVAGKISTADIETWTIFKYLNQHDGKDIVHWLDAVLFAVYSHGGEQTLKNFAVNGRDCPLHAVARFVLQTGRTSLLEVFPRQSSSWSDMSTAGESVFHLLANYKPPVPADFLVKVTKTLLEKGYRNIVKTDRNNMLPYDCLDIKYPLCVFDLFLPNNMCDVSLKAQKLNYIGFLKHRNGEYSDSIVLFSKALEVYPQKDPSVSNTHSYADVLQNRADSYLQLKQYKNALNDAKESMKFAQNHAAHIMAGIALTALKEYEQAFREFLTAYKCAVAVNQTKFAGLFSEMAKLFSKPSERSNDMITHTTQNILGHGHDWAEACYLLAEHNEWDSAKIAYTQFAKSGGPPVMPLNVSLKPFCSIKHIKSNPWVADMMLYLLQCGSDRHTISLEEGDTYLHAVVRISLIANKPNFLKHLVQNYCKKADLDQNKLDSNGNTLIHIAKKEKKVNRKVRKNVTEFLHGCGVDRHVQNNEKKQAGSYLSDEQRNKALIDNMPTKGGIQALHYNQRETKNQRSGTNAVGHERKHRTRTCENCEKLYLNAVEKLSADKTDGIKLLVDLLNMDHANKCHSIIEKAVDDLSKYIGEINQEDVAICLNSLRKEKYFTIIDSLVNHKRWALLDLTIQVYKKRSFALRELKAFAIKFSVEPLILDTSLASEDELRVACCLLDSGWRIGDDNGRMAVKNAVELQKFKLVIELIKRGADISWMSIYNGDTPIHAAICIALKEKQLTFIQELLHMQEEEKDKYLYLDPEQVDANGDCIYHLLAKADYNDFVLQLAQMFCSKIISANYYNKERKYPSDYAKKTHPRLLKFLEDASKIKPSREQVINKELENDAKSTSCEVETEIAQEIKSKHPQQSLTEQTEASRKRIETLISSLPANAVVKSADKHTYEIVKNDIDLTMTSRITSVDQTIAKPKVVGMTENKPNRIKTLDDIADEMRFAPKNVEENAISDVPDLENDDMSEPPPLESDENVDDVTQQIRGQHVLQPANTQNIEKKEDDQDKISDADEALKPENLFENLTWEVEYTDKVRKTLEDKQVMSELKDKIVEIIRMLASGDWRQKKLCKPLTYEPQKLRLFEAKLSKGRRIIWERAISFSSRCSDTADHRLKPSAEDGASQVRGGRIYTELIRVWDIVMDHDKIGRSVHWAVDRIKRSHQRGESCLIRRRLKGLKKENDQQSRELGIEYPSFYTENDPKDDPGNQEQVQYFPPASANETEYHILKFYPWDTTLVNHILQSSNVKVDFPFKVTDLEHAIINMSGKEAILLLGRSGTGKTTCCLYRLWSQFSMYWYKRSIDAPLLPGSERTQENKNNDLCEFEEIAEESNQTTCEENIVNVNDSCEGNNKNENTKHENEENCVENADTYEHFHQLFVTKNHVLAAEVKKMFNDFLKADDNLSKHQSEKIDQALPNRLQDLQENAYPLFLTSRQLLCTLDASVGDPFFEREEDGSFKYHVDGWTDTNDEITDLNFLDYDSADEDTGTVDGKVNDNDDGIGVNSNRKDDTHERREVTYDVFEKELWRKLDIRTYYHPSLVWTEIMSFIKGSYESLSKQNGCLSKDEYIDLGRKRAPNFSGEREDIYKMFLVYERKKKQLRMFDETDVVCSVFQRLAQLETNPVTIHQIYVDETQDFTQAELFLLIRLCQNPNHMFLTGDTAQSIMRGISFRFNDLRTLFYHVKQMTEEAKKTSKASKSVTVHVPKEVHQLTYNYRSHSGILSLASSILEILLHFFPESFDRLDPDQGLFRGPEPILLESCSCSDLAVLLRGNKRKTSNIEFGAHQVILVVNDEARDFLPEELSCALVLTIYESKGLEFDDVLLYNFFKDSQASKEWRIVTKYLEELASKDTNRSSQQIEMCVRIDQDVLSSKGRPRPLDFDPNQHKILNNELKQLYTALTRARVNVWIFDEDSDKRGPMFEYFKARKLVKPVNVTELNEESLSKTIFVEKSSNQDWIQQGDYFMKNRLYGVAAKCFHRGGDQKKHVLALAHEKALKASRKKDKTKEVKDMRAEFLFAAEMYLNCQHLTEAAKCLSNAKEVKLAAALYKKLGEYDKAAELCKKNRQFVECSRFYERSEKFNKAVSILYENGIYDHALDVVKRYKMREMEMEKNGNPLLDQLRANKPDALYTEEKISLRAAEEFHRRGNTNSMHEAVSRFQYEDDKIEFYKRNGYISHAANKLAIAGQFPEATRLYLMSGNLQDARYMAESSRDDKHIAKCLLDISRVTIENKEDMPSNQAAVEDDLQQALSVFKKCGDKNMSGQVMLLQAQLYNDVKYVLSAGKEFIESRPYPNEAGYVECCNQLTRFMDHRNQEILEFLLKGTDCLFNVCKTFVLKSSSSNIGASLEAKFRSYCQFYGIVQQGHNSLTTFPATKPLCTKMLQHNFKSSSHEVSDLEVERSINRIVYYLLRESKPWLKFVKNALFEQRVSLQKCRSFELGKDCTCNDVDTVSCNMMHTKHTATTFKQLIETDVRLIEYEAYCYKADDILKSCTSKHSKGIKNLLSDMKSEEICIHADERYGACRFLWKDFLPESGHPGFLAEDSGQFIKPVRTNTVVLAHMKHYLLNSWNESTHGKRKIECRAVIETEIFLLFEFAYHLFHFETKTGKLRFEKTPKQEMITFENALDNELLKGRNPTDFLKQEKKYTLMSSFVETQNKPDRRIFITCVAHRFTDAYEHLIKGDPYAAILSFAKFQTQLSQRKLQDRSIACFYPDIHHYLFWLEFYSTLAFFLIAKSKTQVDTEFTFIVPNTYIALLHFIQATFPKGSQSIYDSISRRKQHQKFEDILLDRVKRFAFVISGHAQGAKIPEIISKRCKEDNKDSVLQERLIILNMTMLCNVGKCVPVECETSLFNSVNRTFSSPSIQPRLIKIHDQVKEFKGIRDVAQCLKTFLNSRNMSELIHAVKWTPDCKEKCTVLELDISLLPSTFLTQTSTARTVETQESVEDIPQDADLTQEEALRTLQEKEELGFTESKTPEKQTTDIDSASPYDYILDYVWIDDSECRACDIGFESYLSTKATGEECETGENQLFRLSKDSDSAVNPLQRQDSQIGNDTYKLIFKAKHEHEKDPVHIQNIQYLESFKRNYETHLKPLINRVYDFLQNEKYKLFDEIYISKYYEHYEDEIQRLKRTHLRIENELREIFYNRKWSENQEYLNQIADELQNDLDSISAYVEEQTKKIGIQNSSGAAIIEASAAPYEDKDTEENELEKVVPEPIKRTRRYRTGKKKRDSRKLREKNKKQWQT